MPGFRLQRTRIRSLATATENALIPLDAGAGLG